MSSYRTQKYPRQLHKASLAVSVPIILLITVLSHKSYNRVRPTGNSINVSHFAKLGTLRDSEIAVGMLTTHSRHETHALPAHRGWLQPHPHVFCSDAYDSDFDPLVIENLPQDASTGNTPGESKWVEALIGARKIAGDDFKWLLFGDDDVLYIIPRLRRFLEAYDYQQPYIFGHAHPLETTCTAPDDKNARTCCTLSCERCISIAGAPTVWVDCPIKRVADPSIPFVKAKDDQFDMLFPMPSSWPYGGGGIIISRGMMDLASDNFLRFCGNVARCWGYDVRLAACFQILGYNLHNVPQMTGETPLDVESVVASNDFTFHRVNSTFASSIIDALNAVDLQ